MPSPFPGTDPYLEGYLWANVHNALASKIQQQLVPKLRSDYTARLEIYLIGDTAPEGENSPMHRSKVAAHGSI
ncbi:DUF4058 family protein (plasmid) [Kovacikia minuta CCNUW1]|uniref:DUF4058 family protein n=1 Tax=Kovacikia minuta TaxID=2931930 RepID=UPI001CCE80A7|nr:DUF4058 family protein [Kovacikia minuta]UBF30284.1 DUF4058 family protein [Kovacikia minuta CCNUW1]